MKFSVTTVGSIVFDPPLLLGTMETSARRRVPGHGSRPPAKRQSGFGAAVCPREREHTAQLLGLTVKLVIQSLPPL